MGLRIMSWGKSGKHRLRVGDVCQSIRWCWGANLENSFGNLNSFRRGLFEGKNAAIQHQKLANSHRLPVFRGGKPAIPSPAFYIIPMQQGPGLGGKELALKLVLLCCQKIAVRLIRQERIPIQIVGQIETPVALPAQGLSAVMQA